MKQALAYAGPLDFAALRYLLGAGVLFAVLLLSGQSLRPPPLLPTALIGLLQTAAFQGLEQWALLDGGAGHVALLAYTMPFWVIPLAWALLHDRPSAKQWGCIAIAALGLLFVIEPWHLTGTLRSTLFALGGGLAWAIGTVISKRVFQRTKVGPLRLTAWQMLFGTLVLVIFALIVPERRIDWSGGFIAALAYNALLSSGIGWAMWLLIVQRLSANVAGLTSLLVPVAGVLFAWALLHERPSLAETLGIVFIGVALLALNFARRVSA